MTREHTYYQVLGVSITASHAEIKAAYRRTLLSSHPDKKTSFFTRSKHSGSFDVARIQDAYRVLSDDTARTAYDASISQAGLISDGSAKAGPRPAQVISLEEFSFVGSDDAGIVKWTYTCRCGGMYSITEKDMLDDRHLSACDQCSEVVYIGYEVLEEGEGDADSEPVSHKAEAVRSENPLSRILLLSSPSGKMASCNLVAEIATTDPKERYEETVCVISQSLPYSSEPLPATRTFENGPHREAQIGTVEQDLRTQRQIQTCLLLSTLFGATCILVAVLMQTHALPVDPSRYSGGNLRLTIDPPQIRELLLLVLNLTFVKLSVWACGRAHEMALKWTLASEKDRRSGKMRLEFNFSLRFLQSSYDWLSACGLPANVVMAVCLTITYAASSMVLLGMEEENGTYNVILSFVALYVLGFAILTQCTIALYAICTTNILSWSQSPFIIAHILVKERKLTRRPGRCMHALFDLHTDGPMIPREYQRTIWDSLPHFHRFVLFIWVIVAANYYWAFVMWGMIASGTQGSQPGDDWSLFPSLPSSASNPLPKSKVTALMNFGWEGEAPTIGMLWSLGVLAGCQGVLLTTVLTCSEATAQVVSEERLWREAGTKQGTDPSPSLLKKMCMSWHTIFTHLSDPVLHWLFGLAVGVNADAGFQIRPVQMLYVSLAETACASHLTLGGKLNRPQTSQPSTYGHLQTLVDLIDEWHEKMYWGHKGPGHAGTSKTPLQKVHLEDEYGHKDRRGC
ncbi:hypothetical protein ACEPAH_7996 [Sanghuangporus vaninii]